MSKKYNIRTKGDVALGGVPIYDYFDNGTVFIRDSGTVIEGNTVISEDIHDDVVENIVAYIDNKAEITDGILELDLSRGVSFWFVHDEDISEVEIKNAPSSDDFSLSVSITRTKDDSEDERNITWGDNFLFPNGVFEGLTQHAGAIDEIMLTRIEASKWIVLMKKNFN